jgi:hypothetical protein
MPVASLMPTALQPLQRLHIVPGALSQQRASVRHAASGEGATLVHGAAGAGHGVGAGHGAGASHGPVAGHGAVAGDGAINACTLRGHMTFAGLWQQLGSAALQPPLSVAAQVLLLRELCQRDGNDVATCAQSSDFAHMQATASALETLRQVGITAKQLQLGPQQRAAWGAEGVALSDLAALMERYEDTLFRRGLADAADVQRQIILEVAQGWLPQALRSVRHIEVWAGTEVLGARLDLLSAFAARGIHVKIWAALGTGASYTPEAVRPSPRGRAAAFAYPEALVHLMEARGHSSLSIAFDARTGEGPLQALRAAQFTDRQISVAPVEVRRTGGGQAHRRDVLNTVVGWLREGVPSHAIAVVVPSPDDAAPLLLLAQSMGLPLHCLPQRALSQSPITRALLRGLSLQKNALSVAVAIDVYSVLGMQGAQGAALCAAAGQAAGHFVSLPYLLKTLQRCGLPPPLVQDFAQCLQGFVDLPLQGPLTRYLEPLQQTLTRLAATYAASLQALSHVACTPQQIGLQGLADQCEALRGLLHAFSAEQLEHHQAKSNPPWSREEVSRFVVGLAAQTRLALPGSATEGACVTVATPAQLLGCQYDYVAWVGCSSQQFPRRVTPAAPLTETLRARINSLLPQPRLLQAAPLQGRAAMPAQARDVHLWMECLACCQSRLVVWQVQSPADEGGQTSEIIEALERSLYHAPATFVPAPQRCAPARSRRSHRSVQRRVHTELQHRQGETQLPAPCRPALRRYVAEQTHSTSKFDTLGMCAYRYFAASLLNLRGPEVQTLGLTPRESGRAAHAALYWAYADLMAHGGLQAARQQPQDAHRRMQEVVVAHRENVLKEVQVHPLLQEAALAQALQAVHTTLDADLQAETLQEPAALEYAFDDRPGAQGAGGTQAAAALHLRQGSGGLCVRVRGSIDRINLSARRAAAPGPAGSSAVQADSPRFFGEAAKSFSEAVTEPAASVTLTTVDYKSTVKKRGVGRHFQLGLYSLVAQRDLTPSASAGQPVALAAAWRSLKDARTTAVPQLCGTPMAVAAAAVAPLWARLEQVVDGRIAPDPDPDCADLCSHCDFAALCRYTAPQGPKIAA